MYMGVNAKAVVGQVVRNEGIENIVDALADGISIPRLSLVLGGILE
jgi:hypothetical protein